MYALRVDSKKDTKKVKGVKSNVDTKSINIRCDSRIVEGDPTDVR